MKRYKLLYRVLFTLAMLSLVACKEEENNPEEEVIVSNQLEGTPTYTSIDGVDSKQWTYYSLAEEKVMGTSTLGSKEEDEQWRKRTDWDFALCGDAMRTNSGTSGSGNGGVREMHIAFEEVKHAFEKGYLVDEENQSVTYQ